MNFSKLDVGVYQGNYLVTGLVNWLRRVAYRPQIDVGGQSYLSRRNLRTAHMRYIVSTPILSIVIHVPSRFKHLTLLTEHSYTACPAASDEPYRHHSGPLPLGWSKI